MGADFLVIFSPHYIFHGPILVHRADGSYILSDQSPVAALYNHSDYELKALTLERQQVTAIPAHDLGVHAPGVWPLGTLKTWDAHTWYSLRSLMG